VTHAEIEELLGAYALDAVEPGEARVVADHLQECPRCRAELAAHREVAGLLGNAGGEAPVGLWERISGELSLEHALQPEPPVLGPVRLEVPGANVPLAAPSRRVRRLPAVSLALGGLAAALALVVGLLSVKVSNLDTQVTDIRSAVATNGVAQQAALAVANPQHRSVELRSVGHSPLALLVALPDGQAYWITTGPMPELPADQTYQLWAAVAGRIVSIGLLGRAPSDVPVQVTTNMTKFMVTAEPLGGTTRPTSAVVVAGSPSPV
jgi:anti-sigma factor RsiW